LLLLSAILQLAEELLASRLHFFLPVRSGNHLIRYLVAERQELLLMRVCLHSQLCKLASEVFIEQLLQLIGGLSHPLFKRLHEVALIKVDLPFQLHLDVLDRVNVVLNKGLRTHFLFVCGLLNLQGHVFHCHVVILLIMQLDALKGFLHVFAQTA
jgi:hypothetical protein